MRELRTSQTLLRSLLPAFALLCACTPSSRPLAPHNPVPLTIAAANDKRENPADEVSGAEHELDKMLMELKFATPANWGTKLDAIRDRAAGHGLVRALETIGDTPEMDTFLQKKAILDRLAELHDPRAADGLFAWTQSKHATKHFQGVAGRLLAEVGDIRAAKLLGERLKYEPADLYDREKSWEANEGGHLSRSDTERVMAARLLVDLVDMHPDEVLTIRDAAEEGMLAWVDSVPMPHANAMRFLARVGSDKGGALLRELAFPKEPLPKVGASFPFPAAFESASMALRYLGLLHHEHDFSNILTQLTRKTDRKLEITQDALMNNNIAVLGMALRSLAYGASDGLSHFGDPRAMKPLMTLIEDTTYHEEARLEASLALAWSGDAAMRLSLFPKIKALVATGTPASVFVALCYASSMTERPLDVFAPELFALLSPSIKVEIRTLASEALASIKLDPTTETALEGALNEKALRTHAAVSLLLAGTGPVAPLLAKIDGFESGEREQIRTSIMAVTNRIREDDLALTRPVRWVSRANACADVVLHGQAQTWVRDSVQWGFENVRYDNGPHSVTRPVLRYRLLQAARKGGPNAAGYVAVLSLMNEKGALLSLTSS